MYFFQYAAWLRAQHAAIQVDPAWTEIGPRHRPTRIPVSPPWSMDWAIRFPDGYYAYVYERWFPSGLFKPGSSREGRREHFSFHYGPTNPVFKPNGIPERDKINYPAIIRIDRDRRSPHMHFHGEQHIEQTRVSGFTIEDADPFAFIQAVLDYRAAKGDFDVLLKFKVN
jgi:hypothetical protein